LIGRDELTVFGHGVSARGVRMVKDDGILSSLGRRRNGDRNRPGP
jgi:hypothetical protein